MKRINIVSLRASAFQRAKQSPRSCGLLRRAQTALLAMTFVILASCRQVPGGGAPVDLNAPIPTFDTGVDPNAWVAIPAGDFLAGQEAKPTAIDYDYEIMVTDVTVSQYVEFLNQALADSTLKVDGNQIVGFYPGDAFSGAKHELEISAKDYIFVPTDDPASRFIFDGNRFTVTPGYEDHPMTNITWFGALAYCQYYGGQLPTELEWEKAARGPATGPDADRPFPWGDTIARNNANFYTSHDPFEDMSTFGSRTSPVGFYNGQTYDGYVTLNSVSPYELYDMAGNVWQWVGDITPGFSDRFMHGGSKGTYDMDLRIWVRNSAPPMYYSPSVGFRCVRIP
jgi:formylglycine-generating enzyme required for sulfatase activity